MPANSKNSRKAKGSKTRYGNTSSTQVTSEEKFEILDYEADIQITYIYKKIRFFFSQTWMFPVNPQVFVTPYGTETESLRNGTYTVLGIRLTL